MLYQVDRYLSSVRVGGLGIFIHAQTSKYLPIFAAVVVVVVAGLLLEKRRWLKVDHDARLAACGRRCFSFDDYQTTEKSEGKRVFALKVYVE